MDKKTTIKKNKLELEYQALMQERNAIIIAITGVPITILNFGILLFKLTPLTTTLVALLSFVVILILKRRWDRKINSKRSELDEL